MKTKHLLALIAISAALLCSCGKKADTGAPSFPAAPDKIVIGVKGVQSEIYPGEDRFDRILSEVGARVKKSGGFDFLRLSAENPETGEHLSQTLRDGETYVELLYDEARIQSFNMVRAGGVEAAEELEVQRIFLPLSGKYHNCIFIGQDSDYRSNMTLGQLTDNTALAVYVRETTEQMSAAD